MTSPLTVTIVTSDHGPVTIPEPTWCTGANHPDGIYRDDINHTGPELALHVQGPNGLMELLTMSLAQNPYTKSPGVHTLLCLADGNSRPCDVATTDMFAIELEKAAKKIRHLARSLAVELDGVR